MRKDVLDHGKRNMRETISHAKSLEATAADIGDGGEKNLFQQCSSKQSEKHVVSTF